MPNSSVLLEFDGPELFGFSERSHKVSLFGLFLVEGNFEDPDLSHDQAQLTN
jgi:hypothetical protein